MAESRTLYDVLGVDRTADDAEIRRAWKVLVQVWHPDRFTGETRAEAERQTARINEAWSTLRAPDRRAAYDRRIEALAAAQQRRSVPGRPRGPHATPFAGGPFDPAPSSGGGTVGVGASSGTAVAHPEVARPLAEVIGEMAQELWSAARRYPRVTATVGAIWVVVFGGAAVAHIFAGPTLPAGASAAVATGPAATARSAPSPADAALADLERDLAGVDAESPSGDAPLVGPPAPESLQPTPSAAPARSPEAARPTAAERPFARAPAGPGPDAYAAPPEGAPSGRKILRVHPQG